MTFKCLVLLVTCILLLTVHLRALLLPAELCGTCVAIIGFLRPQAHKYGMPQFLVACWCSCYWYSWLVVDMRRRGST